MCKGVFYHKNTFNNCKILNLATYYNQVKDSDQVKEQSKSYILGDLEIFNHLPPYQCPYIRYMYLYMYL